MPELRARVHRGLGLLAHRPGGLPQTQIDKASRPAAGPTRAPRAPQHGWGLVARHRTHTPPRRELERHRRRGIRVLLPSIGTARSELRRPLLKGAKVEGGGSVGAKCPLATLRLLILKDLAARIRVHSDVRKCPFATLMFATFKLPTDSARLPTDMAAPPSYLLIHTAARIRGSYCGRRCYGVFAVANGHGHRPRRGLSPTRVELSCSCPVRPSAAGRP